ncbi:MAG: hypothetical protein F4X56_08000 [Gammaproteobacteria bacterium]|nr:hypothetical protein [Gammaproteobacteria bacterium]
MTEENTTSHAFFFTIIFMTSVVILTIVGYFLFLPKTAPKLITVAVLPFDGPEEFPEHLTRALPRHLTEIIAESREVFVVDYDAAEEAVALKEKSRGFRNELGTTHIVDGTFEVSDASADSWVLKMRLIDVGKDVWKLKWSNEFSYPELSLLEIRDAIAIEVADGLYDNSIPESDSTNISATGFEQFLHASLLFHSGDREGALTIVQDLPTEQQTAYSTFLLSELLPQSQELYVEQTLSLLSSYYPAKVVQTKSRFKEKKNLVNFLSHMTDLAGQYPNSDAVPALALLYSDLGWFNEAENVLLRWSQIRPRSSDPALAIAFNRFRKNDLKGVEHALEIASLRETSNERVDRYRALFEWKVKENELNTDGSDYLTWVARYESGEFSKTDPAWTIFINSLSCYDQVEISLYLNNQDYIFDDIDCIDLRIWLQPPPWWTNDDPNWTAFREDPRYDAWMEDKGIRSDVLESIAPIPASELFAPRRQVLKSNDPQSDQ